MLADARDSSGDGAQPPATSASRPILSRLLTGVAFERVFVVLSCLFAAGAYLDAWSYVSNPTGRSVLAPWQDLSVHGGWFVLTAWLGLAMLVSLTRGAPWREALPSAYLLALAACVAYGVALIVDQYVQLASPRPIGLSRLLSPLPFVEVISGGLIVAAPLRAAWERGESIARIETVVSASLLFSAITFFLQFAHPFRDPWAAGSGPPAQVVWWIAIDFGVTGLLLQSSLLTGLLLFMVRRFQMWPGSFTTICVVNAVLVAGLKTRWEMVTVGLVTGIAGDVLYSVLKPSLARSSSARVFGAAVPVVFTSAFFAIVWTFHGIWWDWNIWTGAILSSAVAGWLVSYLVFLPATHRVAVGESTVVWPVHAPDITAAAVKEALESMNQPGALGGSSLMDLRYLSGKSENRSAELRELLVDIVRELEASRTPRDAEAGRLLVDYYVRRTGTHEVVAERLHLSRPTFYRRLQRGLELVAERLDEMGEALTVVDAWAATPETKIESR